MAKATDAYEAVMTGVSGVVFAYIRGTKKGRELLMEFGEKAIINIIATAVSKNWPLMMGEAATVTDMDREYLISAALGALTKSYKKGRTGTALAGEQLLASVAGHRLAVGSYGYAAAQFPSYLGKAAGNSGAATGAAK